MIETFQWLREKGFMKTLLVDSLATRKILTAWLEANASVTLECLPEEISFRGNCSAIDEDTDREQEQRISDQLDSGNEWAWFTAKVTVRYGSYSSSGYLGACSYTSEAEFRASEMADMVHMECVNLVAELFAARETLERVWELATPSIPQTDATDSE